MLGVLLVISTINVFADARRLAAVSLETSPEKPASLHSINSKIAEWIKRLGEVWVEGQITQINARTGSGQAYLGLRDLEKNASAQVVTASTTIAGLSPSLSEGDRVVLLIKPEYWINSGRLQLRAREIRAVGLGDLLAGEVGAPDVTHLALLDELPHRFELLVDRCLRALLGRVEIDAAEHRHVALRPVDLVQIDVVGAKAAQTALDGPEHRPPAGSELGPGLRPSRDCQLAVRPHRHGRRC